MPSLRPFSFLAFWLLLALSARAQELPFADFVEPDFPFIRTSVDARDLGRGFPERNAAARGIVLRLGNGAFACFDPDLLRVTAAWHGEFLDLTGMAHVSYQMPKNKDNRVPRILGTPIVATGISPGWKRIGDPFSDPRPEGSNPREIGRGPVTTELGRFEGISARGREAVLHSTIRGVRVLEQLGSLAAGETVVFTRTIAAEAFSEAIELVLAEITDAAEAELTTDSARILHAGGTEVTAAFLHGLSGNTQLVLAEGRYLTLRLPAGAALPTFRIALWRGPASGFAGARELAAAAPRPAPISLAPARTKPPRWPETVKTPAELSTDGAAFVADQIALPLPNPWRRQVRTAGIDFFSDGRAAVVTFEGDVWLVSGLRGDLKAVEWKRFASGFFEPLSVQVYNDEVYVFCKAQITRLQDTTGDGEADYYANFSNLFAQSMETRMWAMDMVKKPGGGFYLAHGATLAATAFEAPRLEPGFLVGTQHSGTVLEVSADGRKVSVVATGFREPFIGIDPATGLLTASDQQGNRVPSTPVYHVRQGSYFGVVASAHHDSPSSIDDALVWIPHSVDNSGAGQVALHGSRMGPLDGALIHLSYGKGRLLRVYPDTGGKRSQGAVVPWLDVPLPLLKGAVNPADGQLYLTGFQIFGSEVIPISGLIRVRYTTGPELRLPDEVRSDERGILLRFPVHLQPETARDVGRYSVVRWNYRRSTEYGSGFFRSDGEPGQERLAIASATVSRDGRSVFLHVPAMARAEQVEVRYHLASLQGDAVSNTAYLSVNAPYKQDLASHGFPAINFAAEAARIENPVETVDRTVSPSTQLGRRIYRQTGCHACHSVDGTEAGLLGPSFAHLYGSPRSLVDGTTVIADESYLWESILDPQARVVKGYDQGMPSYAGVLDDTEIEALILYIKSLRDVELAGGEP